MTFFVFHVDPQIPKIGYMRVYEGLRALGGISSFQAENFTYEVKIRSGVPLGLEIRTGGRNVTLCKTKHKNQTHALSSGWSPEAILPSRTVYFTTIENRSLKNSQLYYPLNNVTLKGPLYTF